MSLGFEPMRGLFDFDGILLECPLTTKEREREREMGSCPYLESYNNQMIWQANKKESLIVDLLAMFDL
jgi:hypothetical protein